MHASNVGQHWSWCTIKCWHSPGPIFLDLNTYRHINIFQATAKLNQTFSLMITPYILKKLRYIWQYKTTHTPTKCVVSETLVHKTGNVQYKWTVEFQSTMKRVNTKIKCKWWKTNSETFGHMCAKTCPVNLNQMFYFLKFKKMKKCWKNWKKKWVRVLLCLLTSV